VSESAGASALDRVSVYADAYFLRLREILESDFELTKKALGEERFVEFISEYLVAYPPAQSNAAWVGARLPRFVAEDAHWLGDRNLLECVTLEWMTSEVSFEAWVDERAQERLQSLAPETLAHSIFILDPSVRALRCEVPLEDLWLERHRFETLRLAGLQPIHSDKPWLFLRRGKNGDIRFLRLSATEKLMWDELSRGRDLSSVCSILEAHEDAASALSQLGYWAQVGLIKDIYQDSSSLTGEVKKGEPLT
jgi:hypothetical protein